MKLSNVKNKNDFKKYMKPYGNHVLHILGNYYEIRKVNMDHNLYEIRKYNEPYNKINSKRLYVHGCEPIEIKQVGSEECVKLILKVIRKEKLQKIEKSYNR